MNVYNVYVYVYIHMLATAGSSAPASQNQNKDVSKAGYLALGSGEECTSKLYFRLCTEFDSLW